MKLTCLIIDDEPMARKGLQEYVDEIDFLECVATCESALKASHHLAEKKIDLIYLDIQMPKLSGIDFLKTLKHPPLTIFTTAYTHYAIEGYSLDVIDYLVKPITFERFLRASQKALEFFQLRARAENHPGEEDYFFVRCDSKFEKVFFKDVAFIEALQNYAVLHVPGRKLITYITFDRQHPVIPGLYSQNARPAALREPFAASLRDVWIAFKQIFVHPVWFHPRLFDDWMYM